VSHTAAAHLLANVHLAKVLEEPQHCHIQTLPRVLCIPLRMDASVQHPQQPKHTRRQVSVQALLALGAAAATAAAAEAAANDAADDGDHPGQLALQHGQLLLLCCVENCDQGGVCVGGAATDCGGRV
jgi:hypothetical protein